jgi:D-beta-D-heptose 7-phosphate kinase/D-beta-D-heptose 1-phosphate adenosyltransferase
MNNILVIGDSCKDIYVYGSCDRVAPDAPVPVFVPSYKSENFGMAANVFQNIVALKCSADIKTNQLFVEKARYVDEKTNHMFIRIDSGEECIGRIPNLSIDTFKDYKIVVISDYDKGFLLEEDIQFICENHPLVFIDTKKTIGNFLKDCTYLKINKQEYEASGDFINENKWCYEKLIATLGKDGCMHKNKIHSVEEVEIKDVSGAGDSFLAGLCVNYLETQNIEQAIEYANKCASQVVQKKGVTTINEI